MRGKGALLIYEVKDMVTTAERAGTADELLPPGAAQVWRGEEFLPCYPAARKDPGSI